MRYARLSPFLLIAGLAAVACDRENDAGRPDPTVPIPAFDGDGAARNGPAPDWRTHADRDRRIRRRAPPGERNAPGDGTVAGPRRPPPGDGAAGAATDSSAAGPAAAAPGPRPRERTVTGGAETAAAAGTIAGEPVPRGGRSAHPSALRVQVLLDRIDFSPGAIDGEWGENTEKALYWFQHEEGLEPTGRLDGETYRRLVEAADDAGAVGRYRLRDDDLDGPFVDVPPGIYAKARLACLCYASPLERLAERFHATTALLERLNPGVDFRRLRRGQPIVVPNVRTRGSRDGGTVERIVVSTGGFYTHALDGDGRVVFHFPSTVGSRYSPSPIGDFHVAGIVAAPRFHYTPALYHDVPDDSPETVLPPGPNSPIGDVWIELSAPNYGIHGTAAPATIGYVTSHGCVRLTNWDARALAHRIEPGTPVEFR